MRHSAGRGRYTWKLHAASSGQVKTIGVILVVIVGLLNFHVPHFLLETPKYSGYASDILEAVLLANVICAFTAAAGIYGNRRWGWTLGICVAIFSAGLYVAQETVGLPGLPREWLEPSRIVSLLTEALFVILATRNLRHPVPENC